MKPACAVAAAALLAACATPLVPRAYDEDPGPYDLLTSGELAELRGAREFVADDRLEPARRRLAALAEALPENLVVATFLQDVELAMLARGSYVPGLKLGEHEVEPRVRLLRLYADRAAADETPAALVLQARLTPDAAGALTLLGRAIELDAECSWAHYGRAWVLARDAEYAEARDAIEAVFALDPGHPPTRRLEAALLARAGELELAAEAHRSWLEDFADDPRVAPGTAADVGVDLAALHVMRDLPEEALEVLDAVDARHLSSRSDADLVRATALEMLGRIDASLAAAELAATEAPGDVMPLVHQALLLGDRLGDLEGERRKWEEVLALLGEESGAAGDSATDPAAAEIASLLIRLQASSRLARLEELGVVAPEPAPERP